MKPQLSPHQVGAVRDYEKALYGEDEFFLRETGRLLGQIPTGFAEGMSTVNLQFIEPRTEAEKIARSLGSLLGFVGYIPNPSALALKVAGKTSKKGALKILGKQWNKPNSAGRWAEMQAMSLDDLYKTAIEGVPTNLSKVKSVPMYLTDMITKSSVGKKAGKASLDLLNKSKYINSNKFLAPRIGDFGEGMMHLGLASAISAGGINPFQWKERVDSVLPAFAHGAAFGGAFRGIGQLGSVLNWTTASGSPKTAAKLLQAVAGSMVQGIPSTMRNDSTAEQIYEYLLGSWFGFHEVPYVKRVAGKKEHEIQIEGQKSQGVHTSWHYRNNPEAFKRNFGWDKMPKEAQDIVDLWLKDQYNANSPELYDIMTQANEEIAVRREAGEDVPFIIPNRVGVVKAPDAHGLEFQVPIYHRDALSEGKPIKNGAMFDRQGGRIIIDPEYFERNDPIWRKEGFGPDIDSTFLPTKAERQRFMILHEFYHKFYKSEDLANVVAAFEVKRELGKEAEIPANWILPQRLSPQEKIEFQRYVDKLTMETYTKGEVIPDGTYVNMHLRTEMGQMYGHRGYVVEKAEEANVFRMLIERPAENGKPGEYVLDDHTTLVGQDLITGIWRDRHISELDREASLPTGHDNEGNFNWEGGKPTKTPETPPKAPVKPKATIEPPKPKKAPEKPKPPKAKKVKKLTKKQANQVANVEKEIKLLERIELEQTEKMKNGEKPDDAVGMDFLRRQEQLGDFLARNDEVFSRIVEKQNNDLVEYGKYLQEKYGKEYENSDLSPKDLARLKEFKTFQKRLEMLMAVGQSRLINKGKPTPETKELPEAKINKEGELEITIEGGEKEAQELIKKGKLEVKEIQNDEYVHHSGGAKGADTGWDMAGRKYGVKSKHYREPGAKSVDSPTLKGEGVKPVEMSKAEFKEGTEKATKAAQRLGRPMSAKFAHYQIRNWNQVKHADAVFAVGRILDVGEAGAKGFPNKAKKQTVDGGTGYAVEMAIGEGKPVFVFDQARKKWHTWDGKEFVQIDTPTLTPNFAGVGTRELTKGGMKAIEAVFEKTFGKKTEPEPEVEVDPWDALDENGKIEPSADELNVLDGWENKAPVGEDGRPLTSDVPERSAEYSERIESSYTPHLKEVGVKNGIKDDMNVSKWKSELREKLGNYDDANLVIEEFQHQYSQIDMGGKANKDGWTKGQLEFMKLVEEAHPGLSKQALMEYHNQVEIDTISLKGNGAELGRAYITNAKIHRLFDHKRFVALEPKLIDKIYEGAGLYNEAGLYTIRELLAKNEPAEAYFERMGVDFGHIYDMKHPVGKYARLLIKYEPHMITELRAIEASEKDGRASDRYLNQRDIFEAQIHREIFEAAQGKQYTQWATEGTIPYAMYQANYNEWREQRAEQNKPNSKVAYERFLRDKGIKSRADKMMKYFGQANTNAYYSPNKRKMNYVVINDGTWIKKLAKNSVYQKWLKSDTKSRQDGAIYISKAQLERQNERWNLPDDTVNMKTVINHRSGDDVFIGKGETFYHEGLNEFMEANGLDFVIFDSGAKIRADKTGVNWPIMENMTFADMAKGRKGADGKRNFKYPEIAENMRSDIGEDAVGFIKMDKTKGKGRVTVTPQVLDSFMNHDVANEYIEAYVKDEVKAVEQIQKSITRPKAFVNALIHYGLGAKIKRDAKGKRFVEGNFSESNEAYVRKLMDGANPFSAPLIEQTNNTFRQVLGHIAKPRTASGEWVTLVPESGFAWKKGGKAEEHELKERTFRDYSGERVVVPGEARAPYSFSKKLEKPENITLFDHETGKYVKYADHFPATPVGGNGKMRYGDAWEATRSQFFTRKNAEGKDEQVRKYDLIMNFQTSPKSKPEDMLVMAVDVFLPKTRGNALEANTLDASVAAERDWDGDAGAGFIHMPEGMMREYTKDILGPDGEFRVGITDVGKATNPQVDLLDPQWYREMNDKIRTVNKKIGEVVNRRSGFDAIVKGNMSINWLGNRLTAIKADSEAYSGYMSEFAGEVQVTVDGPKADLLSRPDLLRGNYSMLARGRAFLEFSRKDPIHKILAKVASYFKEQAGRMVNSKNFDGEAKNASLKAVHQAVHEHRVLEAAENNELFTLGGVPIKTDQVYGVVWWKQAVPSLNKVTQAIHNITSELTLSEVTREGTFPEKKYNKNKRVAIQALKKRVKDSEDGRAYGVNEQDMAYWEMYEASLSHGAMQLRWGPASEAKKYDMPTAIRDMLIAEDNPSKKFLLEKHDHNNRTEYSDTIVLPFLNVKGNHSTSPKQRLLKKLIAAYPDPFKLHDPTPINFHVGGTGGGMHTTRRADQIRTSMLASRNNEALYRMIADKHPEIFEGIDYKSSKGWTIPKRILEYWGEKNKAKAKQIAEMWALRSMRDSLPFQRPRDFASVEELKMNENKVQTKFRFFIETNGLEPILFPKGIPENLGEYLDKYRIESQDGGKQFDYTSLDARIQSLWDKGTRDIRTFFMPDPMVSKTGSLHGSFTEAVSINRSLWDQFSKDKAHQSWIRHYDDVVSDQDGMGHRYTEASRKRADLLLRGVEPNELFFPYGGREEALGVIKDMSNGTIPMTPGQRADFQRLFAEYPEMASQFRRVLLGLINKPHLDNHKEIDFVIKKLSALGSGDPRLGVIQRQLMPNRVQRDFLKFDVMWPESEVVGTGMHALKPVSGFGKVFQHQLESHAEIQKEEQKGQILLNSIFYLEKLPEWVSKEYGLENGSMFTKEESTYVEQWKEMFKADVGAVKDLFDIAAHIYPVEYGGKEHFKGMSSEHKAEIMDRYRNAKAQLESLDHDAGRAKRHYVKYIMRQQNKLADFIHNTYWEHSSGKKYSIHWNNQEVKRYHLPKQIKELNKEILRLQKESSKLTGSDAKEIQNIIEARTETMHMLENLAKKLDNLNRMKLVAKGDKFITPDRIAGYLPHIWDSPELMVKAYEESYVRTINATKDPKLKKALTIDMQKKLEDLGRTMVEPPGKEFFDAKADQFDWFSKTRNPAERERNMQLGGWSTELPMVWMKYWKDTVKQAVGLKYSVESRRMIDDFSMRMEKKFGKESEGQVKRIAEFMNVYLRDSMGYIPEFNKRPKLLKYMLAKASGKKPDDNPDAYEEFFSDSTVIDFWNKRSKYKLPAWKMQQLANLEAKYEYLTLLTHPKYPLGNILGGTTNMLVYGGIKRFKQANQLLGQKDGEYKAMMKSQGVLPELMAYEFDVAAGPYKVEIGGAYEAVKEVALSNKTRAQKREALLEINRKYNIGRKAMDIAGKFGTPAETWLRERAFTVGYIMAEEMGLSGDAQIKFSRDVVTGTQYLYHNGVRPEFARTGFGKIVTRFMMYFFSTMSFQKQIQLDAQKLNLTPESEEHKRMQRWTSVASVMMALASIYPYSIFDSALPPHLDAMKDASEMMFGDDDDRKRAFFGTYGLNVITAPMPSRLILRPLVTIMNQDYQRYLNSEIYSWFPFGRFAKSSMRMLRNPIYGLETFAGVPQISASRDVKHIQKGKEKGTDSYQSPG